MSVYQDQASSEMENVLRNYNNKDELIQFLGQECVSKETWDKVIVSTLSDGVVSYLDGQNMDGLQPCSHEEAETRVLLRVKDAMNCGFKSVIIETVQLIQMSLF